MPFRICKTLDIENGHMLSKHPGLCRFPHGHSRTIEIVLASETLDAMDMVCDFKTVKLAVRDFINSFDHSLALNSTDPHIAKLEDVKQRLVIFQNQDPTTEVMAEKIFRFLESELKSGKTYTDERGHAYRFPPTLKLERVRVSETATTWAEFSG